MGEDGKSWSLSRNGNTCCRGGGIVTNGKECKLEGDVRVLYDTIIPAIAFLVVCLIIYWRGQKF